MNLRGLAALLVLHLLAGAGRAGVQAQESTPPVDDVVRRAQVQSAVDDALATVRAGAPNGAVAIDRFVEAALGLVRLGPEAVDPLGLELAQPLPDTFYFVSYTLGLLGGAAPEAFLREAVARAEAEATDFALNRKGWACFGLGLLGRDDAVDLLNEGRHRAAGIPIYRGTSALEAVALLTAPASAPRLVAQLERYRDENDANAAQRVLVIQALGRVADPGSVPALAAALHAPNPAMRHHAARALGEVASPDALEPLLAALADPEPYVRSGATLALAEQAPAGALERFFERLEVEDDPVVRGGLYALLVRLGDPASRPRLLAHWGRPDPQDRQEFLRALRLAPGEWALPVLRSAVADPVSGVAVNGALALRALGGAEAVDILMALVDSPAWPRAQTAIEALRELGETRAGPAVARRLVDVELTKPAEDEAHLRLRAEKLGAALVALGDTSRLDDLRAALSRQTDPLLREQLAADVARLERIRRHGSKSRGWLTELESPQIETRLLAYERLARIGGGGERVARALGDRFDGAELTEALEILRALGTIPARSSRDLVARVLLDPAFDPAERTALRDMAAWSARRLGGAELLAALQRSIERRDGRDALPLFYFAVLGGPRTVSVLEHVRRPRLRYLKSSRGPEDRTLQDLIQELSAGRALPELDAPPERIELR